MIVVYHAANSIEAHIIKSVLEQQNIIAYIFGEYLQGGVGEIPAIGLVTVNVSDNDYQNAKEIVDAWDAATPIEHSINHAHDDAFKNNTFKNNGFNNKSPIFT